MNELTISNRIEIPARDMLDTTVTAKIPAGHELIQHYDPARHTYVSQIRAIR